MSLQRNFGSLAVLTLLFVAFGAGLAGQKKNVEGVTNFTQLDSTIACGGATMASAVPELKTMGFASIVNLRLATEEGANVEAERAAAEAAGLKYFHIPFNVALPEPEKAVAQFLDVMKGSENQPFFVHCASGGRAAAMWLIKRVMIDGWEIDKAKAEADLVAVNQKSVGWALEYARTHAK